MIERSPTKALLVTLAAVMALTSLILGVSTWARITASINAVEKSRELRVRWEHMFSLLKDAETSQRGYQITGVEEYLEPFESAVGELPRSFERLVRLNAEAAGPAEQLGRIRELADRRLEMLREVIAVRRNEGTEAARQLTLTHRGKDLMDELRTRIGVIEAQLDEAAAERTQRMRMDLRWGYLSALGAGVVALGAGAIALLQFRESLRHARRGERLAAGKLRAEQADREKSSFLATMGHEIRTPMNAILGFGELLETEVQTEREKRHVQSILAGGRALLQIINDILDLSKIEAGMMEARPESTDVEGLARFIHQLFRQQAAMKRVEFRIETAPDLPRALLMDEVRMRQILLNLVGNALKFTDRGHVVVRLGGESRSDEPNHWRLTIEVEDSGLGIPADQLADVFKPFVQVGDRREAHHRGTGLGLAIVARLTDLMGGSIAVRSEVGRGTSFSLEFPRMEMCAVPGQEPSPGERRVDFNDLRPSSILAADDNATNRTLMQEIFENTHHRLHVVPDGRQAVAAVANLRPDVVLMDVRMEVMDGREALSVLRAKPGLEVPPVIAVTASSGASEEGGLRQSFDGYVRKPFSRAELFRELARFIPRVDPGPAVGGPPGSARMDEKMRDRWRVLAAQLRHLEESVWPGVRDGMNLSEATQFAARLRTEAAAADCGPVLAYAARLLSECESFAVGALESSLAEFPRLVAEIETASIVPP